MILRVRSIRYAYRIRRNDEGRLRLDKAWIEAGDYSADRIPAVHAAGPDRHWIVLRGRMIGLAESGWRRLQERGIVAMSESDSEGIDAMPTAGNRHVMVETQATILAWAMERLPQSYTDCSRADLVKNLASWAAHVAARSGISQSEFIACSEDSYDGLRLNERPPAASNDERLSAFASLAIELDLIAAIEGFNLRDEVDRAMHARRGEKPSEDVTF